MLEQTSDGIQSAGAEAQGRTEGTGEVPGVRAIDPEARGNGELIRYTRGDVKRFWKNVDKNGSLISGMPSRCWEWTGTLAGGGYGTFRPRLSDRSFRAHRFSWFLHTGAVLSPKEFVCHKCDNRRCVNPDHLFKGDALTNTRDMVVKGRGRHILTRDQVMEIFRARGTVYIWDIAPKFPGVCRSTIWNIWRGRTWGWLTGETFNSPAFFEDMKKLDELNCDVNTVENIFTVARTKREAAERARVNQFSFPTIESANEAYGGEAGIDRLGLTLYRVTVTVEVK